MEVFLHIIICIPDSEADYYMQKEYDKCIVYPCEKLEGEVRIQGAKNTVLPIMAASLLNNGVTVLDNCPEILDVYNMVSVLRECGCNVIFGNNTIVIDSSCADNGVLQSENSRKMRASILFLGSCMARFGQVSMLYPGGCAIGKRPVDYHIMACRKLGADFELTDERIVGRKGKYQKNQDVVYIRLPFPSVGATQNALIYAVGLCDGRILRLDNCATEPEIWDLCNYLRKFGAVINGEKTGNIVLKSPNTLISKNVYMEIPGDRIVAGTVLASVKAVTGAVTITNVEMERLPGVIELIGAEKTAGGIYVSCGERLPFVNLIETGPFPKFPTDLQQIFMTVLSVTPGKSVIRENIFETRLGLAEQLNELGANIEVIGNEARINGVTSLDGGVVAAADLRGGAALIVAGLISSGIVTVEKCSHICRGYENLPGLFRMLGANILEV